MMARDWTPPLWSVLVVWLGVLALTPGACDQSMAPVPVPVQVQR